jgi:hypothetical protein
VSRAAEVVIVVSGAFAPQLAELTRDRPVWALCTPTLIAAKETVWAPGPEGAGPDAGVTLFTGPKIPRNHCSRSSTSCSSTTDPIAKLPRR